MRRTLHNFNYTTFRPAFAVLPDDANLDAIFVQNGTHFVGRQEDVTVAIIANEEAMSVTMALHAAFDFIEESRGLANFFDIQSLVVLKAQVAELVDALVSGTSE